MIFGIDPSSKRLVANILGGAAAGHYRCECTVCLNPVCTCATLHITLFPVRPRKVPHRANRRRESGAPGRNERGGGPAALASAAGETPSKALALAMFSARPPFARRP